MIWFLVRGRNVDWSKSLFGMRYVRISFLGSRIELCLERRADKGIDHACSGIEGGCEDV